MSRSTRKRGRVASKKETGSGGDGADGCKLAGTGDSRGGGSVVQRRSKRLRVKSSRFQDAGNEQHHTGREEERETGVPRLVGSAGTRFAAQTDAPEKKHPRTSRSTGISKGRRSAVVHRGRGQAVRMIVEKCLPAFYPAMTPAWQAVLRRLYFSYPKRVFWLGATRRATAKKHSELMSLVLHVLDEIEAKRFAGVPQKQREKQGGTKFEKRPDLDELYELSGRTSNTARGRVRATLGMFFVDDLIASDKFLECMPRRLQDILRLYRACYQKSTFGRMHGQTLKKIRSMPYLHRVCCKLEKLAVKAAHIQSHQRLLDPPSGDSSTESDFSDGAASSDSDVSGADSDETECSDTPSADSVDVRMQDAGDMRRLHRLPRDQCAGVLVKREDGDSSTPATAEDNAVTTAQSHKDQQLKQQLKKKKKQLKDASWMQSDYDWDEHARAMEATKQTVSEAGDQPPVKVKKEGARGDSNSPPYGLLMATMEPDDSADSSDSDDEAPAHDPALSRARNSAGWRLKTESPVTSVVIKAEGAGPLDSSSVYTSHVTWRPEPRYARAPMPGTWEMYVDVGDNAAVKDDVPCKWKHEAEEDEEPEEGDDSGSPCNPSPSPLLQWYGGGHSALLGGDLPPLDSLEEGNSLMTGMPHTHAAASPVPSSYELCDATQDTWLVGDADRLAMASDPVGFFLDKE